MEVFCRISGRRGAPRRFARPHVKSTVLKIIAKRTSRYVHPEGVGACYLNFSLAKDAKRRPLEHLTFVVGNLDHVRQQWRYANAERRREREVRGEPVDVLREEAEGDERDHRADATAAVDVALEEAGVRLRDAFLRHLRQKLRGVNMCFENTNGSHPL